MPRKKILFVSPTLSAGGAERITSYLLNHIDKDKFKVSLLLSHQAEHTYLENIDSEVEITRLNLKTQVRYSVFPILRSIRKQQPDIVFINMSHLNILIAIFIPFYKGCKWVARENNTLSRQIKHKFAKILYTSFYKNYDTIIAQCYDMKKDLINNFNLPAKKVAVINNPIDTDFIDLKLRQESKTLLPNDKINLVACGRLTYQKGFDNLIRAFAALKYKDKYHLTILGQGSAGDPYNQEVLLRNLVKTHNLEEYISFVGFRSNVFAYLSQADIFILNSRYEGFPNILLEALYCGTPALTNNCLGGINEIIKPLNGLLFDFGQNNFEERLEAITNMTFNQNLIRQDIKVRYNLKRIIQEYESIL